jgi:hypothetical protein
MDIVSSNVAPAIDEISLNLAVSEDVRARADARQPKLFASKL